MLMNGKNSKITNDQTGQIAIFVIFVILFLLLFVGLFLANMTLKQTKITRNIYESVQAYYLADAGTERILYKMKIDGVNPSTDDITLLNDSIAGVGSFKYNVVLSSPLKIKTSGIYKGTSRAIELSWEIGL